MNAKAIACFVFATLVLSAGTATFSQTGGAPLPPADTAVGQLEPMTAASTASTPEIEAERAKIWNSPQMLRARAWAQEYCQRSAKITPQEAKDYMSELQRMSPKQMKLWLLKFSEEEETIQKQQAAFNQGRSAALHQAMGIDQNIQKAYGRINKDETEKAEGEQSSINEERQVANENSENDEQNLDADAAQDLRGVGSGLGYGYGYGALGGYPPAPVHYHYHFHY